MSAVLSVCLSFLLSVGWLWFYFITVNIFSALVGNGNKYVLLNSYTSLCANILVGGKTSPPTRISARKRVFVQ